jgi:hypothetical protein
MAPATGQTTGPKARLKTAKAKVHAGSKMAAKQQQVEKSQNNNSEDLENKKRQRIFRLYEDKFSDENLGNLGVNALNRIKDIIRDVYPSRKKRGGDMKLATVAKVLQTIIALGWMAKDSEERKELKHDNDLIPENDEDHFPTLAQSNPRRESERGAYDKMQTIPVHLASGLQSKVLKCTQIILEESCHNYFKRQGALHLLKKEKWLEEEDAELNLYRRIIFKHPAVKANPKLKKELTECFKRIPYIRHATVHRDIHMSVVIVLEMLKDALRLTRAIGAWKATVILKRWHDEVKILCQNARHKYEGDFRRPRGAELS